MSEKVLASSALSVKLGVTPASTGRAAKGLSRVAWVASLVMNFTNSSAASLFFVFLKMDMLMPATMVAMSLPLAGAGKATTPKASSAMPCEAMELLALFWLKTMAALPLAKSLMALVALSYWASAG